MKNLIEKILPHDLWNISGDFGKVNEDSFYGKTDVYEIKSHCREYENGVYRYSGSFKNISGRAINLNCLKAKFHLGGGEFEVYTQYNGWQTESSGAWQKLNTEAGVSVKSIRSAFGAAPFAAIRNIQTGRGVVFHLIAKYAWSIKAAIVPKSGELSAAEIEIGVNSEGFSFPLNPGETVETPEIIFYEFENKTDLDCFKLHEYCSVSRNAKQMPVIYNSWLAFFDNITVDKLMPQIEKAAEIGTEYFVIDAGWFGSGKDWVSSRGDWIENQSGGLCGKMKDISQKVRQCGMKFGLWFEIESAAKTSEIVKTHPEYFICRNDYYFLNFENSDARNYILETLERNIKKYNIEFIKFDFNQDMDFDFSGAAFINYLRGYEKVIYGLKKAHPEIYLENCASGGLRADLHNSFVFDSFWLSDNQSPLEGMRIFKEGIKRLPPQCIEKWAVVASAQDIFPVYGKNEKCTKIISAHDATCTGTIGISKSFLKGFLSGSPIGISCDLTKLSDDLINLLAEHINDFKSEREFWENASCRILCDTEKALVLCYSAQDKIKLVAYSYKTNQNSIYAYPTLDSTSEYLFEGKTVSGKDITENGIEIKLAGNYEASFTELIRCKKYNKPEHCSL